MNILHSRGSTPIAELRRFFSDLERSKYLFVYDRDDLSAFIAAHSMLRGMMAKPDYQELFVRSMHSVQQHLRETPGLKVILFDVMITLDELKVVSQYCTSLLVFNTKHTLYAELNYRNDAASLGKHVKIISESNTTCPKLVYSCLHLDYTEFPDYITTCDYDVTPETITTPQLQLLTRLERDHHAWYSRYPLEHDIGKDAETLGYRFIDHTDRLARIIQHNAMPVNYGRRKLIYINCSIEDMPGVGRLLLNYPTSTVEFDYFILYDIKDSWVHYEVTRRTRDVDLVQEFKGLAVHGKSNRVVHRRPLAKVTRNFMLHKRGWFR